MVQLARPTNKARQSANMPASLTFGSFGDIITTIQITQQLYEALSESRGSAKRYQEVRQDLESFIRVLMFVGELQPL